eukprot:scaffold251244_cov22-Prasinocladus_malaysianus.AAC.1
MPQVAYIPLRFQLADVLAVYPLQGQHSGGPLGPGVLRDGPGGPHIAQEGVGPVEVSSILGL